MNYQELISGLTDNEKIDLAARLTQAAMGAIRYDLDKNIGETHMGLEKTVADRTFIMFGELLRMIDSGQEPARNPWIVDEKQQQKN